MDKIKRNFNRYSILRYLLLISIVSVFKAVSQIAPADLRCLAVQPNGEVILHWIPPVDPSTTFSSYEIYTSTFPTGPYILAGTLPGSISNSSYTHAASGATIQTRYYYVRSIYGPASNGVFSDSDTLNTIFLNSVNNGVDPDVKLLYNNLSVPPLASTSTSFSISKEYPIGTWSPLIVTTKLNYADTISVCSASINYQVTVPDNSGCVSKSNIQGGVYLDRSGPQAPQVDSISVLPNGDVIFAWQIPRNLDLTKYIIYQLITNNVNTIILKIDTLVGRNNTSYVFTTTASSSQSVTLFVAGEDSCGNLGLYNSPAVQTMLLKANYNRCNYKAELGWNDYVNIPGGISEYRIYASINSGSFTAIGSTTLTSFTHTNVPPDVNITYYVRVFNKNKSISSSSNRASIFSQQVLAPSFLYMKTASISGKNSAQLKLFLDTTKKIAGIDVYRSEDGSKFQKIGFITSADIPEYIYTDVNIEPTSKSYYYKAILKDSCGNDRATSNISKTILLQVEDDREYMFTKHLRWSAYSGFAGGIGGYTIYRVVNNIPSAPITNLGVFAGSYVDNMEDEAPNGSKIEYLVEAFEGNNNPYGFSEKSKSNLNDIYIEGRIFIPQAFSPNGVNKKWLPVTHFIDKTEYTVNIFNRWGDKIFETRDDTVGWDGDGAEWGIYAYYITYKNARGEYQELKGTLLLLE
jgi:hypothetical protein